MGLDPRRGFAGRGGLCRCFLPAVALFAGCELRELPPREVLDPSADSLAAAEAIEAMLHSSARAWNAGNLDGFMDDYWRSPSLTFSGSGGVTRGWEGVRNRYLESYFAPGASRDELRFEEIEVTPLGADHALALGRYLLASPGVPDAVTSSGYFSLVLRRFQGDWRIIHDHTSASPSQDLEGQETS